METTKRFGFMLILVLLTAAAAQSAEGPAKLSNTRMASCLVKITSDPAVLPLSEDSISYLLRSSGVSGKAAREVLGLSPDQVGEFFTIEYMELLASDDGASGSLEPTDPFEDAMKGEMQRMYQEGEMLMEAGRSQTSATSVSSPSPLATTATGPASTMGRTVRSGSSRPRGIGSASRRMIGPSPTTPAAEQTYLFSLNVHILRDAKPAAEEFMDALITNLRNALANAFGEHAGRLKGQLQLAEEEAARAEGDLRQKQDQLREISGSYVLDRDSILGEINNLRSEIQQIEMKRASDQVTVDTTAKRIAELQAAMQVEMQKDPITNELERLLEIQVENFHNVEKLSASGRTSATELADAQEKMARSRIELAQRREQLSKSKGGNQIESLNSTLTDLSMGIAQYRAQLSGYQQQLAQAEELLDKADDYELLSLKADIAKQNLQETILWRDRMTRQIRLIQPPTVSVIGGN